MAITPWGPRADANIELGNQSPAFRIAAKILGPFYSRFVLRLDRIAFEGRESLVVIAVYLLVAKKRAFAHPGKIWLPG